MMTVRKARTSVELYNAVTHIAYEVETMMTAAQFIGITMTSPASDETSDVALDSFLVHYRNLREFLCPDLQTLRKDDIIASDFLDSAQPICFGDQSRFEPDKVRINKLLAHLSYDRIDLDESGGKTWHPAEMVKPIVDGFGSFFDAGLSTERRSWFLPAIESFNRNGGQSA